MDDITKFKLYVSKNINPNLMNLHYIYIKGNNDQPQIQIRDKLANNSDLNDWYLYNPPKKNKIIRTVSSPPVLQSSFQSQYHVNAFLEECCKPNKNNNMAANILYIRYKLYCQTVRKIPCTLDKFESDMKSIGHTKENSCWSQISFS